MFKVEHDPRITKVGAFLRKTSLDELPQFYNILIGNMSLVGTRPPTIDEFKQYDLYYRRRLSIKPGLTGLWQVSGRSDITDFKEVVKLDLEYIDNWSLSSDIRILLMTVWVGHHGKRGALTTAAPFLNSSFLFCFPDNGSSLLVQCILRPGQIRDHGHTARTA